VLIEHVEYIFSTKQLASDYCPPPVAVTGILNPDLSPTVAATAAVKCLKTHTKLLQGSTDKGVLDVFFQEVGLRFFGAICKHIKTLKINNEGAIRLISSSPRLPNLSNGSDFNLYHTYASSLRQIRIMPYFAALKEVGHIFIIEEGEGKAVGSVVADVIRFEGIFRPEEVYEFVQCRVDWAQIKRDVERALFGLGRDDCLVM
jgi:recyclin-1